MPGRKTKQTTQEKLTITVSLLYQAEIIAVILVLMLSDTVTIKLL